MIPKFTKLVRLAVLPIACLSALTIATAPLLAQSPAKCNLVVKVSGIRNTAGDILVALRTTQSTVIQAQTVQIVGETMTAEAVFRDIPQGVYDVAVVHDENKNGTLDFNTVGMPLEGYGHSNNPEKRPGEPNFEETKFNLTPETKSVAIKLIYWP